MHKLDLLITLLTISASPVDVARSDFALVTGARAPVEQSYLDIHTQTMNRHNKADMAKTDLQDEGKK